MNMGDIARAELVSLRHLGQSTGQIDEGIAAVGGRQEEEIHLCALGFRVWNASISGAIIGLFGLD